MFRPARHRGRATAIATLAAAALALTACAPPGATENPPATGQPGGGRPSLAPDETAEGFDLDALVAAAKKEQPITVYDQTGKVVQIAEAFSAKYGVKATGVKIETGMLEKARQENTSGNVIGDVIAIQEIAEVYGELQDGVLTNWVPGDLAASLPESAQYPFLNLYEGHVWTYNPDVYGPTCPVTNVWQLTDEEWKGRVALPDPERYPFYIIGWNQASRDHAAEYEKAYEEYYGKPLETTEPDAVHEWVKRLAGNSPIVSKDSEGPADAVGAPGQAHPAISLLSGAKYRNIEDKGYSMAACGGMAPWAGYTVPQSMTYATKTDSPNLAKLYIHFASSEEGLQFVMPDGKTSFSPDITPAEDPHGLFALSADGQLQPFSTAALSDDFAKISSWQDFWRSAR